MEPDVAQRKLRQVGADGRLEVVLYRGSHVDGLNHNTGHACTTSKTNDHRQGDSLVGRLLSYDAEACLILPAPPGADAFSVYYNNVHSIYPLRRGPVPKPVASGDA